MEDKKVVADPFGLGGIADALKKEGAVSYILLVLGKDEILNSSFKGSINTLGKMMDAFAGIMEDQLREKLGDLAEQLFARLPEDKIHSC